MAFGMEVQNLSHGILKFTKEHWVYPYNCLRASCLLLNPNSGACHLCYFTSIPLRGSPVGSCCCHRKNDMIHIALSREAIIDASVNWCAHKYGSNAGHKVIKVR